MVMQNVGERVESRRLGMWAQLALLAGPVLSMIDSSIVNVAAPSIAAGLRCDLEAVQWVASAYLLAMGVGLCFTPWLAARLGSRRLYVVAIAAFGFASLACAVSPTLGALVLARAVQGLVAAPMVPLAMSALMGTETDRARHDVSVAAGISLFAAPALGPSIGGLLLAVGEWPLVFMINPPVVAVAVVASRALPAMASPTKRRFDALGSILLVPSLTAGLWLSHEVPARGWRTPTVLLAVGALALGAAYVTRERRLAAGTNRTRPPLVDLGALASRESLAAVALSGVATVIAFTTVFLIPAFLQTEQRVSALMAGVALLPAGIVTGVAAAVADRAVVRLGLRRLVAGGLLVLMVTSLGFLLLEPNASLWLSVALLAARAIAVGFVTTPLVKLVTSGVPTSRADDASTAFTMLMRLAASVGIAALVTAAARGADLTGGLHQCSWLMTGLLGVSLPLVLILPRSAAARRAKRRSPASR